MDNMEFGLIFLSFVIFDLFYGFYDQERAFFIVGEVFHICLAYGVLQICGHNLIVTIFVAMTFITTNIVTGRISFYFMRKQFDRFRM